jgi:hypothetical protein
MGEESDGGHGGLDLSELCVWGSFLVELQQVVEAERRFRMPTF